MGIFGREEPKSEQRPDMAVDDGHIERDVIAEKRAVADELEHPLHGLLDRQPAVEILAA